MLPRFLRMKVRTNRSIGAGRGSDALAVCQDPRESKESLRRHNCGGLTMAVQPSVSEVRLVGANIVRMTAALCPKHEDRDR